MNHHQITDKVAVLAFWEHYLRIAPLRMDAAEASGKAIEADGALKRARFAADKALAKVEEETNKFGRNLLETQGLKLPDGALTVFVDGDLGEGVFVRLRDK